MVYNFLKKIFQKIIALFERLVLKERSARKLSLSFSVGLYIAFSPFLGMHTIMVIVSSWFFSLNGAAVFAGAVVNNPWTMIPCHTAGYFLGDFFLKIICRIDPIACNPSWMSFVNGPIYKMTGIKGVSFWSFFIGCNLLGILAAVILYPVCKLVFARLSSRKYKLALRQAQQGGQDKLESNENSCSEQKSISRLRHFRKAGGRDSSDRR